MIPALFAKVFGTLRRPLDAAAERRLRHSMTLVSAGSQLQGSIASKGSLRIEGSLSGDVSTEGTLEVLADASIHGAQVRCNDLLLSGTIDADVVANRSVRIAAGGRLRGNLRCFDLQAPSGASLEGQVSVGAAALGQDSEARESTFSGFQAPMSSADSYA